MTTIAFREGVLAADSIISYSGFNLGEADKIVRAGDYYVALAGSAYLRQPLEEWLASGACQADLPVLLQENSGQFSALVMNKYGHVFEYDNGFLLQVNAPYYAIGSGSHFAIGALAHGASAMEAVAAACKHDKASGGPITYVEASSLLN